MVRTPHLPIEYLEEYYKFSGDIYEYISNDKKLDAYFKVALLISSKSLYNSYISKPDNIKKYKKMCEGLLKYFIRSTSRPTPYGYYAGVSLGEFSNMTKLTRKNEIRSITIDNNWINSIIKNIEDNADINKFLNLKFNNNCYISGDRIKNPHITNRGNISQRDNLVIENSIRYTDLIKLIKHSSKEFINYNDLFQIIQDYYKEVPEALIHKTLNQLIQNEYLFTNLKVPSYCIDSLGYLLDNLKPITQAKEYYLNLNNIKKLVEEAKNNLEVENIISAYNEMSTILKSKDYFEFNLGYIYSNNILDLKIKDKIEKFADTLSDIFLYSSDCNSLEKLKTRFIDQFGENTEVSLIEIIDSNKFNGISLLNDSPSKSSKREELIDKIIRDKIELSILKGEDVYFTKNDFKDIKNDSSIPTKGFDLNIFITKFGDEYNLTVGPNVGSSKYGSMFQRFEKCYDSTIFKKYLNIYDEIRNLTSEDYLEVELRECSSQGRVNNVLNKSKNYDYYTSIGFVGNKLGEIELQDILIGVNNNKLYLKSQKLGRYIKFVKDNMLNPMLNSKLFQLLLEISQSYEDYPLNRLFMLKTGRLFSPRIYIEDIIVSLKHWYIDKKLLDLRTEHTFLKSFNQLSKELGVNEEFYLVESDNRLLININKKDQALLVYEALKKNERITLSELEPNLRYGTIIKDTQKKEYINEMVFSFVLNEKYNKKIINEDGTSKTKYIGEVFTLCDDGWVYLKLYGSYDRVNEIITRDLKELSQSINNPNYFYIRYYDDYGPHTRIRFKFNSENEACKNLPVINNWIKKCEEKALVYKAEFSEYRRESNRYGGEELIEFAEEIFFSDTDFVSGILKKFDLGKDIDKIYISSIALILSELTENKEEVFNLIDKHEFQNQFRNEYKSSRKKYMNLIDEIYGGLSIYDSLLESEMSKLKESLRKFKDKMKDYSSITNTKENILLSITHMHCNRLSGDRDLEYKYFVIFRHALRDIICRDKYKT